MATLAQPASREADFYRTMAIGLATFILFAFAQFALRGFVDLRTVPPIVHLHGAAMVLWLGLFVTQATLVSRDNIALHRKLGWASAVVAASIVPLAIMVCLTVIKAGAAPPFFTAPYFLALVSIESVIFAAMIGWAIAKRRQTDWHRRLILGANVILMEPALGRLLPAPLIGGEVTEFIALGVQLAVVWLIVRHDREATGAVHPATRAVVMVLVASHLIVSLAARLPIYTAMAAAVAT